ncbi:MAG: TonB-dependent receptor domain-containing protein, partial [Gemmatimonadales bacterium]
PKYGDYQGKMVVDLGPNHRVSALAIWADDRFETDLNNARDNEAFTFGRQDLLQGTTGLTWTAAFGPRINAVTSAAWSTSRFDEEYYEAAGSNDLIFRNRSRERALRLRHATNIGFGSGFISVGGDASRASSHYDNRYDVPNPLGGDPTTLEVETTLQSTRAGAFATLAARASRAVSFTLGGRVDHHSATGNTTLSPRGSLAVRLGTATVATASGGVYYQTLPGVLLAQASTHLDLPDPRAVHGVAGLSHLLTEDLRLTVEGYHKRYDRLPVDPDQPGLLPVDELYHGFGFLAAHPRLTPAGTGTTTGVEALLQKRMTRRVYGQLGASYARAFYQAGDGVRRPRVFDNRVVLTAEAGWKAGRSWDVSARWIYAGGAPYTPVDVAASAAAGRTVLDHGRINASRLPAYHALSIRADRRFAIGGTTLNTFLSVWNAYNRENVAQVYWNPATGRVDRVTQWTLLPVFGIEWEL